MEIDIDKIREEATRAIEPILEASDTTHAEKDFLFTAQRTAAGKKLPPYYLVYFLLVDLLGYRNLGQFEKIAWSVPIEYQGKAFLIEHRKFGIGVFARGTPADEKAAAEIVKLIHKGIKVAKPYFDWKAEQAAKSSQLNVVNNSRALFDRYQYFITQYEAKSKEAEDWADEKVIKKFKNGQSISYPSFALHREARWLALSAIESFFSWTEHVFILTAILLGNCCTGEDVANLAAADWSKKYRAALDIGDAETKKFYDELLIVRRQLRNFVAHGSFGKDGEAFQFHSGVGAVPMLLPHSRDKHSFRFGQGLDFVNDEAIALIAVFVDHLWSGSRAPAKIYIQEYELPLILPNVKNDQYAQAMQSSESMSEYAMYLSELMDRYANMDF